MAKIRINPDELNATSQKMAGIQQRLSGLGSELMRISGSAPSYQGQFLPRVLGLSSQAHLKVINRSNQLGNQSSRLAGIAKRFAQADSDFGQSGGLGELFKTFIDKLRGFFGGVSPHIIAQLGTIFSLGSLFTTPAPWNPTPVYAADGSGIKTKFKWANIWEYIWNIIRGIKESLGINTKDPERSSKETDSVEDVGKVQEEQIDKTPETPAPPPAPPRYPVPPTKPELKDVNPGDYDSCAKYARARRPDLGPTNHPKEAAAGYITKFQDKAFQLESSDSDFRNIIGVGYAVVWEPGVHGAHATAGHVAIVEEVGPDYIIVSHANWSEGPRKKLKFDKLQHLWLIP